MILKGNRYTTVLENKYRLVITSTKNLRSSSSDQIERKVYRKALSEIRQSGNSFIDNAPFSRSCKYLQGFILAYIYYWWDISIFKS